MKVFFLIFIIPSNILLNIFFFLKTFFFLKFYEEFKYYNIFFIIIKFRAKYKINIYRECIS